MHQCNIKYNKTDHYGVPKTSSRCSSVSKTRRASNAHNNTVAHTGTLNTVACPDDYMDYLHYSQGSICQNGGVF